MHHKQYKQTQIYITYGVLRQINPTLLRTKKYYLNLSFLKIPLFFIKKYPQFLPIIYPSVNSLFIIWSLVLFLDNSSYSWSCSWAYSVSTFVSVFNYVVISGYNSFLNKGMLHFLNIFIKNITKSVLLKVPISISSLPLTMNLVNIKLK